MKTIGKLFFSLKIKEKRLERRLTEEELARKANISQSYISYLEKENRTKSPTLKTLYNLGTALDICPLELFEYHCEKCKFKKHQEENTEE